MKNRKKEYTILFSLLIITMISRFVIINGDFNGYGWDSGSHALAAKSYDILETRPHWPGYYLHAQSIKFITSLVDHQFTAMNIISIVYSSLAISLLFFVLRKWFTITEAFLLSLITMSSPLAWYYGCLPEMYDFDLFYSIVLLFFGLSPSGILVTPIILGLGTGVRPSSGVLLFPLYLYLWYGHVKSGKISWKYCIISHTVGLISLLVWFIPMVKSVGGFFAYFKLFSTHNPIQKISLVQNFVQFLSFLFYAIPGLIIAGIVFLYLKLFNRKKSNSDEPQMEYLKLKNYKNILFWWIVPTIIFFVTFHYSKGYVLLCLAGMYGLLPIWFRKSLHRKSIYITIIVIQLVVFIFIPYKLPDIETYYRPENRSINKAEVWLNRMHSHFLMTKSNLDALKKEAIVIENAVTYLRNKMENTEWKKKYFFIDPTSLVSARALQAKYSDISFTTLLPFDTMLYHIHEDIKISEKTNVRVMLENALIISRTDFVNKYLNDFRIRKEIFDEWSVFSVEHREIDRLYDLYKSLFIR